MKEIRISDEPFHLSENRVHGLYQSDHDPIQHVHEHHDHGRDHDLHDDVQMKRDFWRNAMPYR